jgi:hypothetical protein
VQTILRVPCLPQNHRGWVQTDMSIEKAGGRNQTDKRHPRVYWLIFQALVIGWRVKSKKNHCFTRIERCFHSSRQNVCTNMSAPFVPEQRQWQDSTSQLDGDTFADFFSWLPMRGIIKLLILDHVTSWLSNSCWNLIKCLLTSSISFEFYSQIDRGEPSNLVFVSTSALALPHPPEQMEEKLGGKERDKKRRIWRKKLRIFQNFFMLDVSVNLNVRFESECIYLNYNDNVVE